MRDFVFLLIYKNLASTLLKYSLNWLSRKGFWVSKNLQQRVIIFKGGRGITQRTTFKDNVIPQYLLIINSITTELESSLPRMVSFMPAFYEKKKCCVCCPKFNILKLQEQSNIQRSFSIKELFWELTKNSQEKMLH